MDHFATQAATPPSLEEVKQQLTQWRATKHTKFSRMSDELWSAILSLTR